MPIVSQDLRSSAVNSQLRIVWADITAELLRGQESHPTYPADPLRRVALIGEEAGEALREALDLTRPVTRKRLSAGAETAMRERVYAEVRECAAMCVRLMATMRAEAAARAKYAETGDDEGQES